MTDCARGRVSNFNAGLLVFILGTVLGVAQHHGREQYATQLGLSEEFSELDVQLAYKDKLAQYMPLRLVDPNAQKIVLEVHNAYERLSDPEMQDEALGFVDYWAEVPRLRSDWELQSFAEFRAGGSANVRVVFITQKPDEKAFEVFGAALRLHGRAQVKQLFHEDAQRPAGGPGRFFSGLKLVRLPAVVLFDPIARTNKISYDRSHVGGDVGKLLSGSSAGSRFLRVLEFDDTMYSSRCDPDGSRCEWVLLFASTSSVERQRTAFAQRMKAFSDACRTVQSQRESLDAAIGTPTTATPISCFWLRLGRAPEWERHFLQNSNDADSHIALFRPDAQSLAISPASVAEAVKTGDAPTLATWFKETMVNKASLIKLPSVPHLPHSMRPDEEPAETLIDKVLRLSESVPACLESSDCVLDLPADIAAWAAGAIQGDDIAAKAAVGAMALVLLLVLRAFAKVVFACCCRVRPRVLREEDAISQLQCFMSIVIRRNQSGEKFGINIESSPKGGLAITGIADGALVSMWNAAEPRSERRIRAGDRIVSLVSTTGGKKQQTTTPSGMAEAFRTADEVAMVISAKRDDSELIRLVSRAEGKLLKCLKDAAGKDAGSDGTELAGPEGGCPTDGLEVKKLGSELDAWNAARRAENACYSTQIEVGDRIIHPNGLPDLAAHLAGSSPSALLVKFRPAGIVQAETLEVQIDRTGPDDRLGMQVRQCPWSANKMEVLEVVSGGAVDRWNKGQSLPKILKGDMLVSANGRQGTEALGEEFRAMTVKLGVERWRCSANWTAPIEPSSTFRVGGTQAPVQLPGSEMRGTPGSTGQNSGGGAGCIPWRWAAALLLLAAIIAGGINEVPPMQAASGSLTSVRPATLGLPLPPRARRFMRQIRPELYGDVAAVLLAIGGLLAVHFVRYEVMMLGRKQRTLLPQLVVAFFASAFLGFGGMFLLTWAGVYI